MTTLNFSGKRMRSNSSLLAPSTLILISSSPASMSPRACGSVNSDPLEKIFTVAMPRCFA